MSAIQWLTPPGQIVSQADQLVSTVTLDPEGLQDFTLRREGTDTPVTGALWLPKTTSATTPMVLCGHGGSGSRYQEPIPFLGKSLKDRGIAVLAIDGPVHGLRKVTPKKQPSDNEGRDAMNEAIKERGYGKFVREMLLDWKAALSAVQASTGITKGPLGYYGLSMGSMFGVPLCSEMEFDAACLGLYGNEGPTKLTKSQLEKIRCPVAYFLQLEDELFTQKGYLDAFLALGSKDKRLHSNPGRHPEMPHEEVEYMVEFFADHLLPAGKPRVTRGRKLAMVSNNATLHPPPPTLRAAARL